MKLQATTRLQETRGPQQTQVTAGIVTQRLYDAINGDPEALEILPDLLLQAKRNVDSQLDAVLVSIKSESFRKNPKRLIPILKEIRCLVAAIEGVELKED